MDKHLRLLRKSFNYRRKKFYRIGPSLLGQISQLKGSVTDTNRQTKFLQSTKRRDAVDSIVTRFSDADGDSGLEWSLALQLGHVVERVGAIEVDHRILLRTTGVSVIELVFL